jgi:hypothetical protein
MEGMPEAVTEGGAGLKAVIEGGAGLKAVLGGGAEAAAPTKPTSEIQDVLEVQVSEDPELMAVSEVSAARVRGTAARAAASRGAEGFVRQELSLLPQFNGRYPVIGCWVVGDEAAGMGLREEPSPITTNRACFVG